MHGSTDSLEAVGETGCPKKWTGALAGFHYRNPHFTGTELQKNPQTKCNQWQRFCLSTVEFILPMSKLKLGWQACPQGYSTTPWPQSRKVLILSQASKGFCNNLFCGYLLCLGSKRRDTSPKPPTKGRATPALDLPLRQNHRMVSEWDIIDVPVLCRTKIDIAHIPTKATSGWTKFSQLLYSKKLMGEARSWCRVNNVGFKNSSYSKDANLRFLLFHSLVVSRQWSTATTCSFFFL